MLIITDATGAPRPPEAMATGEALWIDLLDPTAEEIEAVQRATGARLPSRDDREAIEPSSRLFRDDDRLHLTATVLVGLDTGVPAPAAVAFVLDRRRLITVRDARPTPFERFRQRLCGRHRPLDASGLLVALIDELSDRLADELQAVEALVQGVSDELFRRAPERGPADAAVLQQAIVTIGRLHDRLTKARVSAYSLERLLSFFGDLDGVAAEAELARRALSVRDDLKGLVDDARDQANTVQFLLDTTLGLINVEQNNVMEIVSVVSVVFIPPTLFASIWGMNFARMPELAESWGYPAALGVIALSAVLPYLFFRRKRWL